MFSKPYQMYTLTYLASSVLWECVYISFKNVNGCPRLARNPVRTSNVLTKHVILFIEVVSGFNIIESHPLTHLASFVLNPIHDAKIFVHL